MTSRRWKWGKMAIRITIDQKPKRLRDWPKFIKDKVSQAIYEEYEKAFQEVIERMKAGGFFRDGMRIHGIDTPPFRLRDKFSVSPPTPKGFRWPKGK